MSATTATINVTTQKADSVLELRALISGITRLLPHVDPFTLSRQTYSRADLLARVEARLAAAIATKDARIALHNTVDAERDEQARFKAVHASLRAYLVSVYGPNAPELQQFGYVQNRRPKRSAEKKAAAALKAKATRTARGTKGKKQKAAIHAAPPRDAGTVTPPATPPAPSLHIAATPGATNTPTS